jgi:hypothetical protein
MCGCASTSSFSRLSHLEVLDSDTRMGLGGARVMQAELNELLVLRNNVAHSVAGSRVLHQAIFVVQSGQNRRRLDPEPVAEMMPGRLWPV